MNLELIQERRTALQNNIASERAMQEKLLTGLDQNKANLQALGGALQDLDYWETQLTPEDKPVKIEKDVKLASVKD